MTDKTRDAMALARELLSRNATYQERHDAVRMLDKLLATPDELDALKMANSELLDQMHHFAHADQKLWDESQRDPESFKSWVRSRAAHLLAKFNTRNTK